MTPFMAYHLRKWRELRNEGVPDFVDHCKRDEKLAPLIESFEIQIGHYRAIYQRSLSPSGLYTPPLSESSLGNLGGFSCGSGTYEPSLFSLDGNDGFGMMSPLNMGGSVFDGRDVLDMMDSSIDSGNYTHAEPSEPYPGQSRPRRVSRPLICDD